MKGYKVTYSNLQWKNTFYDNYNAKHSVQFIVHAQFIDILFFPVMQTLNSLTTVMSTEKGVLNFPHHFQHPNIIHPLDKSDSLSVKIIKDSKNTTKIK